jgi:hypothetical protein
MSTVRDVEAFLEAHPELSEEQREAIRLGFVRMLASHALGTEARKVLDRILKEQVDPHSRDMDGRASYRLALSPYELETWFEANDVKEAVRRDFRWAFATAYRAGTPVVLSLKDVAPVQ